MLGTTVGIVPAQSLMLRLLQQTQDGPTTNLHPIGGGSSLGVRVNGVVVGVGDCGVFGGGYWESEPQNEEQHRFFKRLLHTLSWSS